MIVPKVEDFNFQSGFGNLNDISDSIGSIFGFGPEDRDSVLAKADIITQTFFQSVMALNNSGQYDAAIKKLDSEITKNKNLANKYKSANSKAKHNKIADDLRALKPSIVRQSTLRNSYESAKTSVSSIKPNQASMGYIAIGVMALYLFSKKTRTKIKRLY